MTVHSKGGYTILELMIVLAVTGGLFVSATLVFAGRQGKTEFTSSVRDFESKLQSVANDVASGYFQNGYKCTVPLTGKPVLDGATAQAPGTNAGCMFIGKAVQGVRSGGSVGDINILTMVGRRNKDAPNNTTDVASIVEARSVVADNDPAVAGHGNFPNATEQYKLPFGLKITRIFDPANSWNAGSFGFIAAPEGGASPTVQNGSRAVGLYSIKNTTLASTKAATINAIEVPANITLASQGIRICLLGGNGYVGELIIGGDSGGPTKTQVLIEGAAHADGTC